MTLLEVTGLTKKYTTKKNWYGRPAEVFVAVDDVGFSLDSGRTLALVGESGAGKSTTGRLVNRLLRPDAGDIVFEGKNIAKLDGSKLRAVRPMMQMIFQDPYSSLDPRIPIIDSVGEPLLIHEGMSRSDRRKRAAELLHRVGVREDLAWRRPSELSGGQLQRVSIARALSVSPKLIVCDEPVAALDVSIQAQVLDLLVGLQRDLGLSYLFISHDLAIVRSFSSEIAVMKDGQIVEHGATERVFHEPEHSYTQELIDSIPRLPDEVVDPVKQYVP